MLQKPLPTITSTMWHPNPDLRNRWLKKYGKDRFTFEEAREAQSFPDYWLFPPQKTRRWKWLAEAFPPKVAAYLFSSHISERSLVLLDLFAGIGGWSLGAVWSGRFRRVLMVEKDAEKCRYLRENFRRLEVEYDVYCVDARSINYESFERADVVVASPPCEDMTVLKHFSNNPTNKGTIPLSVLSNEIVETLKPKIAFYENVYRIPLKRLMEGLGWECTRFDMSKIIPQKRVRLICIKK